MKRQLVDQFMASALATVVAAVAVAYMSELDLLEWFFIGLVVAISFISGSGLEFGVSNRSGVPGRSSWMDRWRRSMVPSWPPGSSCRSYGSLPRTRVLASSGKAGSL